MDLKELSESVQQKQQQGAQPSLTSAKRRTRSRFQLNLDKTIESCKAQLGQFRLKSVKVTSSIASIMSQLQQVQCFAAIHKPFY